MAQLSATNHKLDSSQNDTAKMQCEVTVRNIKLLLQYKHQELWKSLLTQNTWNCSLTLQSISPLEENCINSFSQQAQKKNLIVEQSFQFCTWTSYKDTEE